MKFAQARKAARAVDILIEGRGPEKYLLGNHATAAAVIRREVLCLCLLTLLLLLSLLLLLLSCSLQPGMMISVRQEQERPGRIKRSSHIPH